MSETNITETQYRDAESWCLRNNHVKVYPVPQNTSYDVRGPRNKKRTVPYVKLVVQIGNAHHEGQELYRQDEQMTDKMKAIYWHYYNKSGNK